MKRYVWQNNTKSGRQSSKDDIKFSRHGMLSIIDGKIYSKNGKTSSKCGGQKDSFFSMNGRLVTMILR